MKTKNLQRVTIILLILLAADLLAGCGILSRPTSKTTPTVTSAAAAESTAVAGETNAANKNSQPTQTAASPTDQTGSASTTGAGTPTLAPTKAVLTGPRKGMSASLRKLGNLRAAPGTEAEILAVLEAGTQVDVLGITSGLDWALVTAPGGVEAWIYFGNLELSGDQKDLVRVKPTATPEP